MKNYFRLLRNIKNYKGNVALNVCFNILSVVFSLSLTMIAPFLNVLFSQTAAYTLQPWSMSVKVLLNNFNFYLSDYIAAHGKVPALELISVMVVVMFFMKNLFRYLGQFFISPVRTGIVRDLRNRMYEKILLLPLSYFTNERKGDLISRMSNDVWEIEWSIFQSIEVMFREPLTVILFLTTMFIMSAKLTLFVLVLLPVAGFLIGAIGSGLRKSSAKAKHQMGMLISMIEETLGGLRVIKAFAAENFSRKKFALVNNEHKRFETASLHRKDLSSPMSEFLGAVSMSVVLYFGGKLVLEGQSLEPSAFIAFIAIFSQLIPPAKAFTDAYYNVQKGLASADRINKILDADITIRDKESPIHLLDFNHSIEYRNVSFAYIKGDAGWVLHDFNLKIEKGKTIALVGQSGWAKRRSPICYRAFTTLSRVKSSSMERTSKTIAWPTCGE